MQAKLGASSVGYEPAASIEDSPANDFYLTFFARGKYVNVFWPHGPKVPVKVNHESCRQYMKETWQAIHDALDAYSGDWEKVQTSIS